VDAGIRSGFRDFMAFFVLSSLTALILNCFDPYFFAFCALEPLFEVDFTPFFLKRPL
jgi:hypothetical protein